MIIARITGGIGNQLFIYAASKRLALKNNCDLVLDSISGFAYDKHYNRQYKLDHFNIPSRKANSQERLEPFSRIRRYVMRKWNSKLSFSKRKYIIEEGNDFQSKFLNLKLTGKVYLEGYFQSENFFRDFTSQIKNDLLVHPPSDANNKNMLTNIKEKTSVAIHIRFTDHVLIKSYKNQQSLISDSLDYYKKAILKMNKYVSNAHYFIFSDQPQQVKNYLPLAQNQMTIVSHNKSSSLDYADLWLMKNCQHFIIAKSTFSWWGAWLSENEGKIIIAPKIRHKDDDYWNYNSLLPKSWIQL